MHICWEEVVALIHFVDTALEVTAVSINDESILNIGIAILAARLRGTFRR